MLDTEVRRQLEEAWLCEMAFTKKKAEEICKSAAPLFMVHLCKCFLFNTYEWYEHWLKECVNYLIRCDDIRIKPKAKRPKSDFFLQDDFICEEIQTPQDAKQYLNLAIDKCPEVGREDASDIEGQQFYSFWNNLRFELAHRLASEDTFDRSVYMNLIDKAIKYEADYES